MPTDQPDLSALQEDASAAGDDAGAALELARELGSRLPLPGSGRTGERWATLAAVGRANLTVARVLEAHADALAILAEAGLPVPSGTTWGVFAAESAEHRLDAVEVSGRVLMRGVKPWCSLGGRLDAALVTAHRNGERQLFAVDLRHAGVSAEPPQSWVARGLVEVSSGPVRFDDVPAEPVMAPGWYLARPGFAWGGMGVAACWHGGAQGIAETVRRLCRDRSGELNSLHVGVIDVVLHASQVSLQAAAAAVDQGRADGEHGRLLALRVRAVVAAGVERTIHQAGHALGPAPLAFDADHARRVADLGLYVRQHHGERDLAALGAQLLQM